GGHPRAGGAHLLVECVEVLHDAVEDFWLWPAFRLVDAQQVLLHGGDPSSSAAGRHLHEHPHGSSTPDVLGAADILARAKQHRVARVVVLSAINSTACPRR